MKKRLVGLIALLALSGCDRNVGDIAKCISGESRPVSLQQAIAVVKAAGLQVSSQVDPFAGLSAGAAAPAPATPERKRTVLLCEAEVSGQRLTTVLHFDSDANTVNDIAASVTHDEIKWTTKATSPYGKPTLEHHQLNRLNGDYRAYEDGVIYAAAPPTYHCSPAPEPAF